jgi:cyclic pyranopterin phosphate synthase
MVNVGSKEITSRKATAQGRINLGETAFKLVLQNSIKKGDVLTVAQIAGINAAKQTGYLIPLCHPIVLTHIKVKLEPEPQTSCIIITSTVECFGKTGVEVEAIMAVSVACCTVYDMCKAVDKGIVIEDIRLISKSGGVSGTYMRDEE